MPLPCKIERRFARGREIGILEEEEVTTEGTEAWIEGWIQRLEAAGWEPVLLTALEGIRALGPLLGQAILFGQPLLKGFVEPTRLSAAADWLSDPQSIDRMLARIERGSTEGERSER